MIILHMMKANIRIALSAPFYLIAVLLMPLLYLAHFSYELAVIIHGGIPLNPMKQYKNINRNTQ